MNITIFQKRLYRVILLVGAILSAVCIAGNYLTNLPWMASVKWIVLLSVAFLAFLFSGIKRHAAQVMFGVFLFLICAFLPYAFMDTGGSSNLAIGYAFLLLIAAAYLFHGWKRVFLSISLIVVFTALHVLEYYYPHLITAYGEWTLFIDRAVQIPLLMAVSFFVIIRFVKEYEKVSRKLFNSDKFDELTGLYKRRTFIRAVEEAAQAGPGPYHFALLDIDNFQKINDRYGYMVGDDVLKELSAHLLGCFGVERHMISRWGGDEFAILYDGDKEELLRNLNGIRKTFGAYASAYEETAGLSAGVVTLSEHETVSHALIAADRRLNREKEVKFR